MSVGSNFVSVDEYIFWVGNLIAYSSQRFLVFMQLKYKEIMKMQVLYVYDI